MASPDRNETQRRLSGIHRWTWGLRTLWRCFRPGWLLVPFVFALAGGGAMVAGIWIPEKEPFQFWPFFRDALAVTAQAAALIIIVRDATR